MDHKEHFSLGQVYVAFANNPFDMIKVNMLRAQLHTPYHIRLQRLGGITGDR